ncbi:hypothetical protein [Bacillus sp. JCM 19041]|uniref:hypothetical protein n=1 Tax=Bacillus sp. JCM 19041 TaxID=1460637 RepID=UPI000B112939
MKNRFWQSQSVATIIALFSTMLFLFPVYWMFTTSIKPMSSIFSVPPELVPSNVTAEAYTENILKNPDLLGFFLNSLIIAGGTLILTLLLAAPIAYAWQDLI